MRRTARGRARRDEAPPIDLVLYVSPGSRYTQAARRNCEALLARFDRRRLTLEICDVSRHPERAEIDAVYFTPMLVKRIEARSLAESLSRPSGDRRRWRRAGRRAEL